MPRPDDSPHPEEPEPEPTEPESTEAVPPEPELTAEALDRARARSLRRAVLRKTLRHERAQRRSEQSVWSFLGTFGLIGWTVALPTLAGLAFGLFLDDVTDTDRSFAITFLVVGATVGCLAAWYWVKQESRPDDG
jgi:ATP synthase protein I